MEETGSLKGKTVSILGDSISTFEGCIPSENAVYYAGEKREETGVLYVEDTWWAQSIEKLGLRLLKNGSYSGSKVCGSEFPFAASKERAEQMLDGSTRPDVVIFFIGINDYGGDVPDGIVGFKRDYLRMLTNVRHLCPNAILLPATLIPGRVGDEALPTFATQLRGVDICEFNDQIRAVSREVGAFCLDIASFGFDYETTDGTHPNKRGMEQISAMMQAWILNSPELVAGNEALFPKHLRSSRTCELKTCMGCSFAESTGEQWSCICNKLRAC